MRGNRLAPRQERFVDECLIDLNVNRAPESAGYNARTPRSQSQRLSTQVDIQSAVEEAMVNRSKRTGLTQERVVNRLKENVERAMQAMPVLDQEGNETGQYVYQGQVENRALELLGRQLGMFPGKIEHVVKGAEGT